MRLIAIETSGPTGSVAVLSEDRVFDARIDSPRDQTARILPLVDEVLTAAGIALAQLDGIAFGRGPGSFTGIRVATAVAQGLGLATGIALLPVSSLAATAQRAWREAGAEHALVCIDARMREVFWCGFEIRAGLASALGDERLSPPGDVTWVGPSSFAGVGSAFATYPDELAGVASRAQRIDASAEPTAMDLLPLAADHLGNGLGVAAVDAAPRYLRGHAAWER